METKTYEIAGVTITETKTTKTFRSEGYNMNFDKVTGFMQRWGKTLDDDPEVAPFPEILDVEITTICNGPAGRICPFCYKSNTSKGHNMSFDEFKIIIDKMPFLTQIAIGSGATAEENPEMFEMMYYAREKGIIPNITLAQAAKEVAEKLAGVAGAVAVSVYKHAGFDIAYGSVDKLTQAGCTQINLHYMLSGRTIIDAYSVIQAIKTDPRLSGVNAIVFLGLKQKGRGTKFDYVTREQYKALVDHCLSEGISFGFDSCSSAAFIDAVKGHKDYEQFREMSEDCESTLVSSYINEKGEFFPCSFTEGWSEGGWDYSEGINVLQADNFIDDVWNHHRTIGFREVLLRNKDENGCRNCPAYAVCGKDMRVYKDSK